MATRFDPILVTFSVFVAIFASYVALNISQSVVQVKRRYQAPWLALGSIAMGIGIWSMHFVGMLAFEMPGMEMAYDIPLMILSVVVAVVASLLAFTIVSRPVVPFGSILSGGIAMAAAISGMHYIGMYSMRMGAIIQWNIPLVVLSIFVALIASFGALFIFIRIRNQTRHTVQLTGASVVMGFAVSGMHYVGMLAATFIHSQDASGINSSNLLVTSRLVATVSATTILILFLALVGSLSQKYWTRRRKSDIELLEKSEDRFRRLVEAVEEYAIIMLDTNGHITTWNLGAERINGYKSEEVLGRRVSIFYTASDLKNDIAMFELEMAATKGSFKGEGQRIRKDGSVYWASVVITPVYESDGTISGFSKVVRDITSVKEDERRQKRINEELEERVQARTLALTAIQTQLLEAKESAEAANETKSAFLANMSHEIRTPLGAVLGFAELLSRTDLSAADRENSVNIIKRNGKLLSNIINDILDLSKVEAGKLNIEKVDVAFEDVLNEISSVLSLEASEKGIRLEVLSDGPTPDTIRTDPLRLRQILLNIVGNAIKFTKQGEVTVTVKLLRLASDISKLAFVVKDTGEGISEDQISRLFRPFSQADVSTTRKFGGTGLGLILSKKLAESLGGTVELSETATGKGSTFLVTIDPGTPEKSQTSLRSKSQLNSAPAQERALQLKGLRVLLVEDSPDNQLLVERILNLAGASTVTANNGEMGVEMAQKNDFDVVLMDLQMPVMDGYMATHALRSVGYKTPIIALTAHAMKEERERALSSGFDDHITKPIDPKMLVASLTKFIGH